MNGERLAFKIKMISQKILGKTSHANEGGKILPPVPNIRVSRQKNIS